MCTWQITDILSVVGDSVNAFLKGTGNGTPYVALLGDELGRMLCKWIRLLNRAPSAEKMGVDKVDCVFPDG